MIASLRLENEKQPATSLGYVKRLETQHIDCGRALKGESAYLSTITGDHRIPLIPNPSLKMSCSEITKRILPRYSMKPLRIGGIAFARNVFADYEYIEKQIQMTWHPQNRYCFVVAENADSGFFWKVEQLVKCFGNQMIMLHGKTYSDLK
ncbi:hypothetical protein GCK72_003521 [Caenorhabditis remanei]|uniref:Uncharacterized protein n=1 Tax=Caenorhabditis remanei TaxID=31234 RepID=A0A6A5HXI2_CAERE|nr:hypothetical protein GCK72_003521 [Caenorhabditis remanei]KAF1771694.1 hypothetical protein GCK72_003521 [Caenorhabditis remanei]